MDKFSEYPEIIFPCILFFLLIILIIRIYFNRHKDNILEQIKISISAFTAVILVSTFVYIAIQAYETKKTVKLQQYNITLQNRPVVNLGPFFYLYNKAINISGIAEAFGTTPAQEFKRIRDIVFYVEPLESKVKKFLDNNELTKLHFYFYELVYKISDYIVENPNVTEADLRKYLDKIKDSKKKIIIDVGGKPELILNFNNSLVYRNIKNWRRSVILLAPGHKEILNTTRSTGDLLEDIANYKKILIYYCAYQYEGLVKDDLVEASYIGYLSKSPYSDLIKVTLRDINTRLPIDGYPLQSVKTWVTRKPIPK